MLNLHAHFATQNDPLPSEKETGVRRALVDGEMRMELLSGDSIIIKMHEPDEFYYREPPSMGDDLWQFQLR